MRSRVKSTHRQGCADGGRKPSKGGQHEGPLLLGTEPRHVKTVSEDEIRQNGGAARPGCSAAIQSDGEMSDLRGEKKPGCSGLPIPMDV